MLLHLLLPFRIRQLLHRCEEIPILPHPLLKRRPLRLRHRVDSRLHRRIRLRKSIGTHRKRAPRKIPRRMPDGPVPDHIQKNQHRQHQPPFVTPKSREDLHHFGEFPHWTLKLLSKCVETSKNC
jgi:hypothetical protein